MEVSNPWGTPLIIQYHPFFVWIFNEINQTPAVKTGARAQTVSFVAKGPGQGFLKRLVCCALPYLPLGTWLWMLRQNHPAIGVPPWKTPLNHSPRLCQDAFALTLDLLHLGDQLQVSSERPRRGGRMLFCNRLGILGISLIYWYSTRDIADMYIYIYI